MGRIAKRRHTAISIHTNGIATERHWMPKRSDCPYPEVICSEIHDATTFEHYQFFSGLTMAACAKRIDVNGLSHPLPPLPVLIPLLNQRNSSWGNGILLILGPVFDLCP